ncbi:hypothetical protein ScPMuIL_018135 [Solemya velum]
MAEDEADVNFQGYVLTNFPTIIEKILRNLPFRCLNSCARVCRVWEYAVKAIKARRKSVCWTTLETNNNVEALAEEIKEYIEQLWIEPMQCLTFCSTNLFEEPIKVPGMHTRRCPRATKCERMDIGNFIKRALPKHCSYLAISADGVVGTKSDLSKTVEIESEKALSCLMLPKIEDFDLYSFTVDIYRYANRMEETNFGSFSVDEVSTVPKDKKVKAILFFCDEPFCPPEIGYSLLQHYGDIVVAGGNVDNLICPQKCSNDPRDSLPSLMCIAFCGERLHVASAVIREEVTSQAEVEKALKTLKDCNFPEQRSFAFMFACIGRGQHHYNIANVESDAFKKLFPKTPLLGFFGNGEVGFNYLPKFGKVSENNGSNTDRPRPLPKLYHAYTTIFCLMALE